MRMSHLSRLLERPTAVAALTGLAAAVALGALNRAAHPMPWGLRLLWAAAGLMAAAAAVLLAARGKESIAS